MLNTATILTVGWWILMDCRLGRCSDRLWSWSRVHASYKSGEATFRYLQRSLSGKKMPVVCHKLQPTLYNLLLLHISRRISRIWENILLAWISREYFRESLLVTSSWKNNCKASSSNLLHLMITCLSTYNMINQVHFVQHYVVVFNVWFCIIGIQIEN